jgi:outer membrane protein assembly factor BamB
MQQWNLSCTRKSVLKITLLLTLAAGSSCAHPQPQPAGPRQFLFVTLPETRSVAIFAAGTSGEAKPLATIQEKVPDAPVDASANLRGEVFVGNSNGSINVYAGRNFDYQLVRALAGPHTGLVHPTAMVVDPMGSIYVADRGAGPGAAKVLWLSAATSGNVYPNKVLSGPHTGLTSPTGVAIDASGEVFIADHDSGKVLVFDAEAGGDAPPLLTIDGLKGPRRVFVDQDLNIYVSCDGDSTIAVLAPNGPRRWTRIATISSAAMRAPEGVTTDNTGRIAAAVHGAVLYFAAGADGPSTPVLELQGPVPMNPTGLVIR